MAKFIKFTNAAEEFDGKDILVNVDHIFTVTRNEEAVPVGATLYCPGHNWFVKETLEEVLEKINSNKY